METNIRRAIGIELSHTRIQMAEAALVKLKERGLQTRVDFYEEDFMTGRHWSSATIIFTWAECFQNLLMV